MRLALILSLLIALAAVVFAAYNGGPMDVAIPFTGSQLVSTKPVVLISTLLIGVLIGVLASIPGRIAAGLRARRAEKRLDELGTAPAPAVVASAEANEARLAAAQAHDDAVETQRLADEVARRTATVQRDVPPPPPEV